MHDDKLFLDFDPTDPLGPLAELLDLADADAAEALAEVWALGDPPDQEELEAVRAGLVERGRESAQAAALVAQAQHRADELRRPQPSPEALARGRATIRAIWAASADPAEQAELFRRLLLPPGENDC